MPVFPLKCSNLVGLMSGALCAGLLMSAVPARAGDDDPPELKIMDGIMGAIGLTRGNGPQIEYHERSPLVLPRGKELPAPQSASVKNPNWPVDPEVKEAKALADSERYDGRTSSQRQDDARLPLSAAELNKGRTTKRQNNPRGDETGMMPLTPSALGYNGGLFSNMFGSKDSERGAAFTGEAPRTSLTEPPVGYQTPSPNAPYSVAKERFQNKAIDSYTEHGMNIGR